MTGRLVRHVSLLFAALVIALLRADILAAEDAKPVISTHNKSIELDITIDEKLKADPALYDNLLAEARREAAKWRKDADAARARKDFPFKIGGHYEFNRGYTQRSAIGRYISVLRTDATFTGGAHPNGFTDTILWDTAAKKRISVRPFFKESADNGPAMTTMAKLVRAAVYNEKKARDLPVDGSPDTDGWLKDITPSLLKLGPITLAPSTEQGKSSGFTFHFSPYAVGPYVEGPLTTFVPWSAFKDHLSPEGVALFGGERPEGDDQD